MSDVRPFEEYKEMIQDMSKEEMIKGLYDLSARVIKQENIIKEVREYITSQKLHKIQDTTGALTYQEIKLLEILDREEK